MALFWDSSAILPIVLEEPHSSMACSAWRSGEEHFAWNWMELETHAALVRRKANAFQWQGWRFCLDRVFLIELSAANYPALMRCNEVWKLRSADAGHVYLFETLLGTRPDFKFVTFDAEMRSLCEALNWPIWDGT